MDEQFDGLEQIVEDEFLDENLEYQDECEPNVENLYEKQMNETEIENAIDRAKEEQDDLKDDGPEIVELESEFANAKISSAKEPLIIRYIKD